MGKFYIFKRKKGPVGLFFFVYIMIFYQKLFNKMYTESLMASAIKV